MAPPEGSRPSCHHWRKWGQYLWWLIMTLADFKSICPFLFPSTCLGLATSGGGEFSHFLLHEVLRELGGVAFLSSVQHVSRLCCAHRPHFPYTIICNPTYTLGSSGHS